MRREMRAASLTPMTREAQSDPAEHIWAKEEEVHLPLLDAAFRRDEAAGLFTDLEDAAQAAPAARSAR